MEKITIALSVDYDVDELTVPAKWVICGNCRGNGKHVNRAVDGNGLSAEDFYEDPDFAEDYFSGVYDVACSECQATGKVLVPDEDKMSEADLDALERHWEAEADYAAECAAERRMGA